MEPRPYWLKIFYSGDPDSIRDWSMDLSAAPYVSTPIAPLPATDAPVLILASFGSVALAAWMRRSRKQKLAASPIAEPLCNAPLLECQYAPAGFCI